MIFIFILKVLECILFSSILIIIGSILMNPQSIRHFLNVATPDEKPDKFKPTSTLLSRLGLFIILIAIIYIFEFIFGIGTIMNNTSKYPSLY